MIIGSDGKVYGTRTVRSTYSEEDTKAIDAALRNWHFKPTYYHGMFVNAKQMLKLKYSKFQLNIEFPDGGCRSAPFATM